MLISIVICSYNGEKYLKEQLQSIINQSYEKFEIIIVDDCSRDDTISIVKAFQSNYSCIKFFQNESNLGYEKNFEKAISLTTGDYIALADQDDVWEYNKLELLVDKIKKDNTILVYSNAMLVDNILESQNRTLLDNIIPIEGNNNLYFLYNNSISGNTMMFKKELKEQILPFPNNIGFHDIWIGFVASSYDRISYVNENLVKYRQHDDNVTNINKDKVKKSYKKKIENKKNSHIKFIQKLENYIDYLRANFPNSENLLIMESLLKEFNKYDKYFFNIRLFLLLYNNKGKLFFQKKEVNLMKVVKMSVGIRVYKLIPFI